MVKKTLLYSFILLILYSFFVSFLPNDLNVDQNQWGNNVIKAQDFLYTDTCSKNVIVGSSLAFRLITDTLGANYTNLALTGLSFWDGLEMIKLKKQKPKVVLIESNMFFRPGNHDFQEYTFSPFNYKLKKYLPILRTRNQPVGVFKGLIYKLVNQKNNPQNLYLPQENLNESVFSLNLREYNDIPTPLYISNTIININRWIEEMNNEGVIVVIFEIPMEERICNSKRNQSLRNMYPKFTKATFIPLTSCEGYHTGDGLHLNPYDALRYTKYLKSEVRKLGLD